MAFDLDMESYGRMNDSAAASQQVVDTNFYQQEVGEQPLHPELVEQPVKEVVNESPVEPEVNPQAENFRALREEVDRIKAERDTEKREHQLQLDMLRANLAQQSAPKQPEQPSRQMFDGMRDDDIPNVAELRREWNEREAGYQARLEELQVQQMYPDYAEVIEKFALPLVKQKPHLAQGIQGASNKALMAYELGKMAQQMQAPQPAQTPIPATKPSETAQRIVENSRKPGTLSQAGGQGALSKADYFASMSDREFSEFAKKNLDGI